jgi:pimeloyl-ACP methyl ester carboxylesterase
VVAVAEPRINGFRCHHEVIGSGEPVVLVHGGWIDSHTWDFVVPSLAEAFQVVTYDRRGHSRSERPTGSGPRATDEADITALSRSERPILLTDGDQSPSWLPEIVSALGPQLEGAAHHTFVGAGNIPHQTHPDEYVETVAAFIQAVDRPRRPAIHA